MELRGTPDFITEQTRAVCSSIECFSWRKRQSQGLVVLRLVSSLRFEIEAYFYIPDKILRFALKHLLFI